LDYILIALHKLVIFNGSIKMNKYHAPVRFDFAARVEKRRGVDELSSHRRKRLAFLKVLSLFWGGLLIWRLFSLQVSDVSFWQNWASKQHQTKMTIASERGPIYDRNQTLLTVSVPAGSVYVRPKQVKDPVATARQVAAVLDISTEKVAAKLRSKSPFVWIQRQVPRVKAVEVAGLELPGVGYFVESRRFYPHNFAASSLLGRVGIDGNGLSGIEAAYEQHLKGDEVKAHLVRDALGKGIRSDRHIGDFELPKGAPLQLTVDATMQMILDEELESGRRRANAESAMAVMMDADTGEILAMSQAPLVNFNEDGRITRAELRNKVVETVFEPGSIMKPLVTAAAMEMGLVKPDDYIDCEKGHFRFGGRTINDVHGSDVISVHDIVVRSSNIGMTKIGSLLGKQRLYEALRTYGFGDVVNLNLPGQTSGILRHHKGWATVDIATHSFGQGIAVTPLQMVRAVSSIVNGGYLPEVSLLKDKVPSQRRRILSERTTAAVREMMFGVVEDDRGTARRARMKNVRVGGKTGTAQKARDDGRGYEPGAYIASFVGFVDAKQIGIERKIVLAVIIDEPNTTSIYGGTLAAPVFKRVIKRTLHHLSTSSGLKRAIVPGKARQESRNLPGFVRASFSR
jgi:cell division protein FtsI (penicillin-binding protein 3)